MQYTRNTVGIDQINGDAEAFDSVEAPIAVWSVAWPALRSG